MSNFLGNFLIELGLFSFLGLLYYFYQRRKILHYEENKVPLVMGFILQSCLAEKKEEPQPQLDSLIESLDDYLHNRTSLPPMALLAVFQKSQECSEELGDIIREGLLEIDGSSKK